MDQETTRFVALGSAEGNHSEEVDSLVDSLLRPAVTSTSSAEDLELSPEDHDQLRPLHDDLLSKYLDPIGDYVRLLLKRRINAALLSDFRELLAPVLMLSETMEVEDAASVLRRILAAIDTLDAHVGRPTFRQLNPFSNLFEELLDSLSESVRQQYLDRFLYRPNTNPLLEEIRRIKFIGPRRIQRLYAAGLHSADAICSASAQEMVDVTGIHISLSRNVIEAAKSFVAHQRKARGRRLLQLSSELTEALLRLGADDGDLVVGLSDELSRLVPVLDRVRDDLDAGRIRPPCRLADWESKP